MDTRSRRAWAVTLLAIIALGILSRVLPIGWPLWDKYLGDALYAAMVYALIRLFSGQSSARIASFALVLMTALELFQLTLIPAQLATSQSWPIHMAARLLGTYFSFLDLAAYAFGIWIIHALSGKVPDGAVGNAR